MSAPSAAGGPPAPRIGLFGLLGTGNLGNDGSFEAVLAHLRSAYPDAVVDCLCGGPERVHARYGIPATPLNWYHGEYRTATGVRAIAGKALGKLVDAVRTAVWVRRHDAVIVPGMGVLEATLPVRPWGFPYSLLLLCASGRFFGTKVALVGVGAEVVDQRATRWILRQAAGLADYRSYRDEISRTAMRAMGVDISADEVHPDLAFALPAPQPSSGGGVVGVGVMAYHGGNGDRAHAREVHASYVGALTRFVRRLADGGHRVRLFTGDHADEAVVQRIIADVGSPSVTGARPSTLGELMREMAAVDTVVATRYHNVVCALKLGKPTLSIGYAAKNDSLMADMGLGEFCQSARDVDVDRLLEQFGELRRRARELSRVLTERSVILAGRLDHQFAALSAAVLPRDADAVGQAS